MKNPINFFEGYIEGEELWFSNLNFNALMKMNITTGETEMVDIFPGFPKEQENLHLCAIKYEDCLYFMPFVGNMIHVWNLLKMSWEESIKLSYPDHIMIARALQFDDSIWVFSSSLRMPIVKVDLYNKTSIPMLELSEQIKAIYSEKAILNGSSICVDGDKILFSTAGDNKIIMIDRKKEQILEKYTLGTVSISGIKVIDKKTCLVWFLNSSEIWVFDYMESKFTKVSTNIIFPQGRYPFFNIVHLDKTKFLVLPWHIDQLVSIDIENGMVTEVNLPITFKRSNPYVLLSFSKQIQNKKYLFPRGGNKILVIHMEDLSVSAIDFVLHDELQMYIAETLEQQFVNKFYTGDLAESICADNVISKFLDLVCEGKQTDLKIDEKDCGISIHNEIKKICSE